MPERSGLNRGMPTAHAVGERENGILLKRVKNKALTICLMRKTCDIGVLFKEIYRKRLGFISV